MSVKIRLTRAGAKKRPFYRVVVADSRSPRDGRFIEKIGTYDPMQPDDKRWKFEMERVQHWLQHGALPTDRVARQLDKLGVFKWRYNETPKKSTPKAKAQERMKAAAEAAQG